MALSNKECAQLRVIINRANAGPAWFNESIGDPIRSALHAELRYQTRVWLSDQIARELQRMLPPHQRVTYNQSTPLQAPERNSATEAAALAEREQMRRLVAESEASQEAMKLDEPEWWPELDKVPEQVPAPTQVDIASRNRTCPAGSPNCIFPHCSCL